MSVHVDVVLLIHSPLVDEHKSSSRSTHHKSNGRSRHYSPSPPPPPAAAAHHKRTGPHFSRGAGPHVDEYTLQKKQDQKHKDDQLKVHFPPNLSLSLPPSLPFIVSLFLTSSLCISLSLPMSPTLPISPSLPPP